ncbi:hypothetical protein DFH06DRAFT_1310074 [Mycena polygramma]|nr:hypothetical protein DFH06DRAFT_1310074 [Mycena polygramma]
MSGSAFGTFRGDSSLSTIPISRFAQLKAWMIIFGVTDFSLSSPGIREASLLRHGDKVTLCKAAIAQTENSSQVGLIFEREVAPSVTIAQVEVIVYLSNRRFLQRRKLFRSSSHTLIAIVERMSMPDQRVVVSTLRDVVAALDSTGEQRPPGIMVVGWAVLALWGTGDVAVLDEGVEKDDEARVKRWLGDDAGWRVKEGLLDGWDAFQVV